MPEASLGSQQRSVAISQENHVSLSAISGVTLTITLTMRVYRECATCQGNANLKKADLSDLLVRNESDQ